jgi:hypothetical protein
MLRSKYFWITLVIFIPFIVIWIMEGFGWAIATLIIMGLLFLFILASASRRRRRYYYYDDNDKDVIVTRRTQRTSSSFNKAIDLHVPKVNQKGAEFITGSSNIKRRQEEDMKRIKKNLWG